MFVGASGLRDDPDAYARLAGNWARSGVLGVESADGSSITPTAFRPPLYPWLLSWMASGDGSVSVVRIAMLHLLLGLGTVWLVWSIAQELKIPWPWLPALLVAVDPLLLRASQLVMTETLAAFLTVLAWRLWLAVYPTDPTTHRPVVQWVMLFGLGSALGVSVLARPTAGPWVALCAGGLLFVACSCWKRRVNDCLVVSLLVVACVSPWIVRNMAVMGKPIWATTHGGYTLLLANNPLLYEHFKRNGPSRNWDAEPFHERWGLRYEPGRLASPGEDAFWFEPVVAIESGPSLNKSDHIHQGSDVTGHDSESRATMESRAMIKKERKWDELSDDALAYSAAWDTIARQPRMFGVSSIYRLGWLWAIWPNTGSPFSRLAIGGWYALMFALASLGLLRGFWASGARNWLRSWWLPLALALSLSIIHAIYWSNMRMRAPAMAAVYVAASMAIPRPTRHPLQDGVSHRF